MKDMVSIDDFVKNITFEPCLLHKVNIKLLKFQGGDKVVISGVVSGSWGRILLLGSRGQQ